MASCEKEVDESTDVKVVVDEYLARAHTLLFTVDDYRNYVESTLKYEVGNFNFSIGKNHFIVKGRYRPLDLLPKSLLISVQNLEEMKDYRYMNLYSSDSVAYISTINGESGSLSESIEESKKMCDEILSLLDYR